ncbi:MAG: DUF523 and DUF1722 domain-containing protein [Candidatus Bathyarchaeota archaeon]|nr:DUF523 and DUF1722 domain-containing protein [Candidatus Bathyarchaeota archaeon]
MEFARPVVVVSKCIEFERVRWNSEMIASDLVKKLKDYVEFIPVCPEVGIGLSVPREPLRIVKKDSEPRLLQPATGRDFTGAIKQFSAEFLDSLPEVDGFILKSRSPSSAMKDAKIYPSTEKTAAIGRGPGFFGGAVLERFGHLAVEDESRLLNERIKWHFLTKLYTLADFRAVKASGLVKNLVDFQAKNKLLFTAYSQKELHEMGRIVANQKGKSFQETTAQYQQHLYRALQKPPQRGANENVLTKAAGYFTSKLGKEEKAFFLDLTHKYKEGKLELSTPLQVLRSWIIRFKEDYLMAQTFFEPYPQQLTEPQTTQQDIEKDYWK